MKKLLFLALLLAVSLFVLAACNRNGENGEEGNEPEATATPAPEETPPPEDDNGGDDEPVVPEGVTRASILADLADWPAPSGYIVNAVWTALDSNILAGWTNPMPLAQARVLMAGLETMSRNPVNDFFPNPMVMVGGAMPVVTDNPDGSRTYTFTIYTENRFSDGTYITAAHYAGGIALFLSPQWSALVPSLGGWFWLEGRAEWSGGESEALVGVRLYSDSQFSVTSRAQDLPNVWEAAMQMNHGPTPLHMYGVEARDNGNGVFLTAIGGGELTFEALRTVVEGAPGYLMDADGEYILDGNDERIAIGDGVRYNPTVVAGPYMFESIDVGNGVLTLRANPYFPGTWDGYRPRIETVIFRQMPQALMTDALAQGEAHVMISIDDGTALENAMEVLVAGGTHTFLNYDQFGHILLQFHTDTGPTQFRAVRQAISFMIDRHEIAEAVGRGFSVVAHGPWAPAWWWYQEAANRDLYDRVTIYDLNMERAIQLLEDDGWIYNADGSPFVRGEDTLRHKMVDEWHWGTRAVPVMEEVLVTVEVPILDEDGEETGEYEEVEEYQEVPTGEYNDVVDRFVWEYNEEGTRMRPLRSNKVYTGERVLMPLILNWVVRDTDYMPRDQLELQLFDNLAYAGGLLLQERTSLWGSRLQGGYRDSERYELHLLGVGMATLWAPWQLMSLEWIPNSNWGQVDCERTRELSDVFRVLDITTPEGYDAFIEAFIDYMEHLTYEAFTLPFHMSLNHDFFPHNLGNWYNNPIWQFPEAVQRAYWMD